MSSSWALLPVEFSLRNTPTPAEPLAQVVRPLLAVTPVVQHVELITVELRHLLGKYLFRSGWPHEPHDCRPVWMQANIRCPVMAGEEPLPSARPFTQRHQHHEVITFAALISPDHEPFTVLSVDRFMASAFRVSWNQNGSSGVIIPVVCAQN